MPTTKPRQQRMNRRKRTPELAPSEEEMAENLAGNKAACLAALRDLRIAMRHVAGGQALQLAYAEETGGHPKNANKWAKKESAQYWLEAVQLAKEATDETIAAAIEGSQLMTLADPEASHRDKTAAAALLAKVRGLDRVKIEVTKTDEELLFESMLKECKVKNFGLPGGDAIDV
jgi:hypothetical protein